MSQGSSVASGLVRVTIASGSRRVDLVLPGSIPVAELVPELARSVGLLDASTVYGGYRLVTQEGRILVNNAGLTMQGIEDGGLLTVTAGVDDKAPRVYDDMVEAMADVVENELKPWEPAAGRRTALGAGSILLGLGALALLLQGESLLGGVAAAVIAGLLVVGGVVLARAQEEPRPAWPSRCSPRSTPASPGCSSPRVTCPRGAGRWTTPSSPTRCSTPASASCHGPGRRRRPAGRPPAGHPGRRRRRGPGGRLGADPRRLARAEHGLHRADDPGRAGRKRVPLARPRRHRHQRRPDLLPARHHRRPRRDRPRRGRRRRAGRPRDPARRVGDRRHPAGPVRPARGRPRRLRHRPGGRVLPGRHVPHPPVPHRGRGAGRTRSPASSGWCRWRSRCC